ncbi:MAG TPA: anhydro-N-acetylmuramic acid kinase [Candidatus Pullichristensenella stercoripullorum]|nr:anhydro-N-acetylmuramic acid kinase [Candidatus Pullichristensenella stercoripullorum]
MLEALSAKGVHRVVGMMSGTSVDGVDAALIELSREGGAPRVKLLAFENIPYPQGVRERVFELFRPETSTVDRIGYMNFLLGELYARAALSVIAKAGLTSADVDLIGSHGQTIWHEPEARETDGMPIRYTVQIGEGAVIAARTGIPTVSDFRVADMAVGGQGAPLVPFSEYLLYRREDESILLQNIGGIGNMTVLPAGATPEQVFAFDTGPGNMIIDAVAAAISGGRLKCDVNGGIAARGKVDEELLARLQKDEYYARRPPKTTGRERFGTQYAQRILDDRARHPISDEDLLATVTYLTAWSIFDACERFALPVCKPAELIVGGGGSYNKTLLKDLSGLFGTRGIAVRTQEDLGFNSDAKEAVAFALMADCFVRGEANVLPSVTGASAASVMGKLSLPPRR